MKKIALVMMVMAALVSGCAEKKQEPKTIPPVLVEYIENIEADSIGVEYDKERDVWSIKYGTRTNGLKNEYDGIEIMRRDVIVTDEDVVLCNMVHRNAF